MNLSKLNITVNGQAIDWNDFWDADEQAELELEDVLARLCEEIGADVEPDFNGCYEAIVTKQSY